MKSLGKILKEMTPTEGVVLRYVITTENQPVEPTRVINHVEWSNLPHSFLAATNTLKSLLEIGAVRRQGKRGYTFTDLGRAIVKVADDRDLWQQPIGIPDIRGNK